MTNNWNKVWKTLSIGSTLLVVAIYLFVFIVDPYDNLPFSLQLDRAPIANNQRFAYPAIAKNGKFDSLIIGTSTTRMLNPEELNSGLESQFANLSMNSATTHEQQEIFNLFVDHHDKITTVIIGVDGTWCNTGHAEKYTFRPFPPWMYDNNKWNDLLYVLNDYALENSVRLLEYTFGLRPPRYGKNGYKSFLPDDNEYDLEKARKAIYKNKSSSSAFHDPEQFTIFPDHEVLGKMMRRLDNATIKIIMFVPYHVTLIANNRAKYEACKNKILELTAEFQNIHLVDFMISSAITTNDSNYWDPLHYNKAVATKIAKLLSIAINSRRDQQEYYIYLNHDSIRL